MANSVVLLIVLAAASFGSGVILECPPGYAGTATSSSRRRRWHMILPKKACVQSGGMLVSTYDSADNDHVAGGMQSVGAAAEFWIGLRRVDGGPRFKWLDGSEVVSANWYPNQPDNGHGKGHCGQGGFGYVGAVPGWNDISCPWTGSTGYTCKAPKYLRGPSGPAGPAWPVGPTVPIGPTGPKGDSGSDDLTEKVDMLQKELDDFKKTINQAQPVEIRIPAILNAIRKGQRAVTSCGQSPMAKPTK